MDAGDFDYRPNCASGNNSCPFLRGLQKDMFGAEQPMDFVRNRSGSDTSSESWRAMNSARA